MRFVIVFLLCLSGLSVRSQEEEVQKVGKTIDRLLSYLSFLDSSSLHIDSLHTVFVTEGKLTANFGKKPVVFLVSQYITEIRKNVLSGQLKSSVEKELMRKVDVFGKIAHVLNSYELTIVGKEGKTVRRGLNSIQLIKQEDNWLILSLLWDRESDVLKLPAKYLSR